MNDSPKLIIPSNKDAPKYNSTIALVLKNGVQVSTKCKDKPAQVWEKFDKAFDTFVVEVGDPEQNIMKINVKQICLISVMNYIEETKAAKQSGLLVPDRSIAAPRRMQ